MPSRRALVALTLLCGACTAPPVESGEVGGDRSDPSSSVPPTTAATVEPPPTLVAAEPSTTSSVVAPDERPLPDDAAGLAGELTEAELAIRDPSVLAETAAAWGRRQQRLYRLLARNSGWEVAELVDPVVAQDIDLNRQAREALSSLVTSGPLSTELPAWRIRAPLPVAELRSFYDEGEAATGIAWEYLAAINLVETRMGRIEGLSTAGATGPMQFLPSTWAECCQGDPTVDRDAIVGAAVYLRDRGGPGDMTAALYGYNNSDYYVTAVSAYAEVLRRDPLALRGYHAWEVYFATQAGLVRLPEGYEQAVPVDAVRWMADHPEHVLDGTW